MSNKGDFERVIADSGLWSEGGPNHHFLLSPSVYELSCDETASLQSLGEAIHECLSGIGRLVAIAATPGLVHGRIWNLIDRIGCQDIPRTYRPLLVKKPGSVPAICKVDLMESINGGYKIAEIDGHNKHGMGYSTLAARLRSVSRPEANTFPGAAKALAKWIEQRGGRAAVIYAQKERFYRPELLILAEELARHSVELVVASEAQIQVRGDEIEVDGKGAFTNFVDFPFLDSKLNQELPEVLAQGYLGGRFSFAIPPKPFLGSKALLGLLANVSEDQDLEAILRSQISSASLKVVREHLPKTFLVDKNTELPVLGEEGYVLKETVSSGMKGTIFSSDENFTLALAQGRRSNGRFVLQEEVVNQPRCFEYWDEQGKITTDTWFMRVTVHYSERRVADVVVTARRDKKVHGAIDCLQLGTVLV